MKFKKKWSGRTSGTNIHNVRVYLCDDCQLWHNGKKPAQCAACGCMAFTHFHSKAEAKRFGELTLEQNCKHITELKTQPPFKLHAYPGENSSAALLIGKYIGDFSYIRDGKTIVEDVKGGADTDLSVWKRKHAEAEYGIKIDIIRR